MPHFVIDYSPNLEGDIDLPALVEVIRKAALATGVFPIGGLRVRAFRADHYSIGDGDPAHAYLDLTLRIGTGRDIDTRKAAGNAVFAAVSDFLDPVFARRTLSLSFEIREIDPVLNWKRNNLHEVLKGRGHGS